MIVKIKRLSEDFSDLPLPTYSTSGSAGMDLCAAVETTVTIEPGAVEMVPTNLSIALAPGHECQIRSRSGLAAKNGIFALNAPGTVDSDYRGAIKVILANFGKLPFAINRGDRIAQMVVARYETVEWSPTNDLDETDRGSGGFGSTGMQHAK